MEHLIISCGPILFFSYSVLSQTAFSQIEGRLEVYTKENFQILDDKKTLRKLASVDFGSWNYKGQNPATFRHYGIMAQDLFRLFGKDDFGAIGTDTMVNPID